jgi:MSHA biogenesis protein MshN
VQATATVPPSGSPPAATAPTTAHAAHTARTAPTATAATAATATATAGKTYSAGQLSANLIGEAVLLDRQGRQDEAKLPLEKALEADPRDAQARQLLVQLHLDTGHVERARALLGEGRRLQPDNAAYGLMLARLMVDGGDVAGAIRLLEADASKATDEPQVHAFLAAMLLRAQRYDEAARHYLVALRYDPANAAWLVGAGVALEAIGKPADAVEAYRRASDAPNLKPETSAFLSERLARLVR